MKSRTWIIIIFVATLLLRLYFAFSTPHLTYESYSEMRHIEHITEKGVPLYHDELSYGGRTLRFLPFFHYLIALFNLFLPLEAAAKIVPNILIASLTIIVYLIGLRITENKEAALFSGLIAGLLPILYSTNTLGVESLFLPLVFLAIFGFLNLTKNIWIYVISFIALSFTSSAAFLLLMGFGIYVLLSYIEQKKIRRREFEMIIFSIIFYIWSQFLFFKDTLLTEGFSFIWQNIPKAIISQYFPRTSVLEAIITVSVIPFLIGIYVVYRSLFQLKSQKAFLLISLAISTTILTWFRAIEFTLSLMFFGVILAALFSEFYQEIKVYVKRTKLSPWNRYVPAITAVILITTMIIPAADTARNQTIPSDKEIAAFAWLKENTPEDAGILALLEEGHLVTFYAERRNVMDTRFQLIEDVEERFYDVQSLYTTPFQTLAVQLLNKYDVQYVVLTQTARDRYKIKSFSYITRECFEKVYDDEVKIYKAKCVLREL